MFLKIYKIYYFLKLCNKYYVRCALYLHSIFECARMYICMCMYVCVCMFVCVCVCMFVCGYVCMFARARARARVCVCVCVCVDKTNFHGSKDSDIQFTVCTSYSVEQLVT